MLDKWMIMDKSGYPFKTGANGLNREGKIVYDENTWKKIN